MRVIAKIFAGSIAVIIAAFLLPGIEIKDFVTSIIVAVVLAILNSVVKPILIILTIPVTVFTLGLFLLAINAFIILIADYLVSGFQVDGFWWALLFSIVMTVIMSIFNALEKSTKDNQSNQP